MTDKQTLRPPVFSPNLMLLPVVFQQAIAVVHIWLSLLGLLSMHSECINE